MKNNLSRRKFLGQISCGAIGYSTLLSTLVQLKGLNAAAIANSSIYNTGDDYKALVCLFQSGGNDSFNMLLPKDSTRYEEYAATRSNLAIPREEILGFNTGIGSSNELGVHPVMTDVQRLFNEGNLAFLSNIGTLVEPMNKDSYFADQANIPLGLFSHADQIQQWQTGFTHERSAVGWGGRIADLIRDVNSNDRLSMNLSLSGTNILQTGNKTVEYAIDPYNGSIGMNGYGVTDQWDVFNRMRTMAIDSFIEHNYQDAFEKTYVDVIRTSRDGHEEFQAALNTVSDLTTEFSDNYISQSFQMVARSIAAAPQLGMKRQIYFINYGGWDHHDEVLVNQDEMLGILSSALGEFYNALTEINQSDCVTTFSISEFGRTLTSNGNGTDHAWGGNVMAMGGAVNGGRVYGEYPSLALEATNEVGDGVLIPKLSVDEYFSELALWFGVSPTDLPILFPNVGNFFSPAANQMPIGFLNI